MKYFAVLRCVAARYAQTLYQAISGRRSPYYGRHYSITVSLFYEGATIWTAAGGCPAHDVSRSKKHVGYEPLMKEAYTLFGSIWGWKSIPTKQAFSKARYKVDDDLMTQVYQHLWNALDAWKAPRCQRWRGGRVFAVDATRLTLLPSKEILDAFGRAETSQGPVHHCTAILVVIWDVLAMRPLAWRLLPAKGSERAGLDEMIDMLEPGDLLIADREYPSRYLMADLEERGVKFLMRMPCGARRNWSEVDYFLRNRKGGRDQSIPLAGCQNMEQHVFRWVRRGRRFTRHSRKTERRITTKIQQVLVTNISDQIAMEELFDLYERRWDLETQLREMKSVFARDGFHGTRKVAIHQEVAAYMMMQLIASALLVYIGHINEMRGHGDDWRDPKRLMCNHLSTLDGAWDIFASIISNGQGRRTRNLSVAIIGYLQKTQTKRRLTRSFPRVRKTPVSKWHKLWRLRMLRAA